MKRVLILPSFERSLKRLTPQDRKKLSHSLEAFNSFLLSGDLPQGLGFKKINHDKYEFRADIRLRVIVKVENDDYCLVLAGNHDEVKRYLRNFR
jgi:mRNA-degrading endonuclease RelE of RelBE toxin-antitoxin system